MHWTSNGKVGDQPQLPDGVAKIFALQSNNSLLVSATPHGYTQVETIVKVLDIAQRQVELKVLFAAVPISQNLLVDLADSHQALLQLHSANAIFCQTAQIAPNNASTVVSPTQMKLPRLVPQPPPWSLPYFSHPDNYYSFDPVSAIQLTPRINSDNSVTMNLDQGELAGMNFPKRLDPLRQMLTTFRPTPSGATIAYEMTNQSKFGDYRVFLFMTPTIVSVDAASGGTISVKP